MFLILSKLPAFLITPIIWVFILLLFALLSKKPARKRKALLGSMLVFYVFSNSFLLDECMRLWEVPAVSTENIKEPYDAGIVLGGVITYDPTIDRFQFLRQGDRLQQAVLLYRKGKIKKILFSGGADALDEPENKEGPHVKAYLIASGIPESDILIEGESRNTRQNALFTKQLLDKTIPKGRFLLITSAYHERRAIRCFEKAGVSVSPYSTDRYSGPRKYTIDHLLLPNAGTLVSWDALTHELLGICIYKLMGYA